MSNICDGVSTNHQKQLNNSRAFCEGRKANADGALVGTDPHGGLGEASVSWVAGFNDYTTNPTVLGCCAT